MFATAGARGFHRLGHVVRSTLPRIGGRDRSGTAPCEPRLALNPRLADPPPPSGLGFILGNPLLMNVHSAAAGDGSCDNTTIASGARQLFQPSDTPCRTPQSPMQTDLNSHPHRTSDRTHPNAPEHAGNDARCDEQLRCGFSARACPWTTRIARYAPLPYA